MRRSILYKTLAALFILSAGSVAPSYGAPVATQVQTHVTASGLVLRRYELTQSMDDLRVALVAMNFVLDIETLTPDNFIDTRRALVLGYARIITAIERSYDPTFDPNDQNNRPIICVPPPGRIAWQEICNDPQSVKDPDRREAFVAAIQANDVKIRRSNFYWELNKLELGAMGGLTAELDFLRKMTPEHGTFDPDSAALDAILRQAGVSDQARVQIDPYFLPKPCALKNCCQYKI